MILVCVCVCVCVYNLLTEIDECNENISRKDSSGGGAQQNRSRNQGQSAALYTIFTIFLRSHPLQVILQERVWA